MILFGQYSNMLILRCKCIRTPPLNSIYSDIFRDNNIPITICDKYAKFYPNESPIKQLFNLTKTTYCLSKIHIIQPTSIS